MSDETMANGSGAFEPRASKGLTTKTTETTESAEAAGPGPGVFFGTERLPGEGAVAPVYDRRRRRSESGATETPGRGRANRANARKSTGPKSARGKRFSSANATRLGLTAGAGRHLMAMLGEDPEAFEALGERLEDEWRPATETARQLVAQLAELFWKQQRLARAEQALVARQVDELESGRAALAVQIGRAHSTASEARLRLKGLVRQPDSPGKFEDLIGSLGALAAEAKARRSTGPWDVHVELIWGAAPTVQGLAIRGLFHQFAAAGEPGGAPPEEEHVRTMLESLDEEIRGAREAYAAYRARQVEITPARRESEWAPTAPEWTLLIRQRNSVFRQIERTIRLLVTGAASCAPSPGVVAGAKGGDGDIAATARPKRGETQLAATKKKCKTKPIRFFESTKPQSRINPAGGIIMPRPRSRSDPSERFPASAAENESMAR